MSKPSLHELISDAIFDVALDRKTCNTLAEQIIKIVRDYHLVEDSNE